MHLCNYNTFFYLIFKLFVNSFFLFRDDEDDEDEEEESPVKVSHTTGVCYHK